MPDRSIDSATKDRAIHYGSYGLAIFAFLLGGALLQDRKRFHGPAWDIALALPVGSRFWALYLMVCGLSMLAAMVLKARSIVVILACFAVSFVLWARCTAGIIALCTDTTASFIGPVMFGAGSILFLAQGVIHFRRFRQ